MISDFWSLRAGRLRDIVQVFNPRSCVHRPLWWSGRWEQPESWCGSKVQVITWQAFFLPRWNAAITITARVAAQRWTAVGFSWQH